MQDSDNDGVISLKKEDIVQVYELYCGRDPALLKSKYSKVGSTFWREKPI